MSDSLEAARLKRYRLRKKRFYTRVEFWIPKGEEENIRQYVRDYLATLPLPSLPPIRSKK
jgi:hypothetical protein